MEFTRLFTAWSMLMEALVAIDIDRTAGIIILSLIHSKPAKIAPKFPTPSQSIVRTGCTKELFATPLFKPATIPIRINIDSLRQFSWHFVC